ncbi:MULTISPECIES: hypothetical protein [unclassified Leeuwenhoekiella]|uniref:hypothetical protein n=1 Tax=unclassified Leeuwenhoekiella TaxID=2615029 RepID=UPI000C387836|nr:MULTISPECIES: hypothetical protein [unclassified Leeuwenhoekiella]MAW94655.1 hypothetical protein [Leeuwenhoekiella sp.]MBA82078.1 hypothetical protein [Leeuwenhoekiella sp.]|tara:strand:- start:21024 stop:21524 length:501 start_codon:yes stop_codon:yes gene_type:complete
MNNNDKHIPKDFKLPENYFEQFEKRLFTELKFQELYPDNKDGFSVPDGYFDKVETLILAKTTKEPRVITLNYRRFAAAVATIAALFALLFYAVKPNANDAGFEGLSLSNLENYLIEQDRIQDFFSVEELNTIEANTSFFDEDHLSDEVILEYVDQDVIEYALNTDD